MGCRRIESFLLRLVMKDQEEVCGEEWVGRVQHVPSGKEFQFSGVQELLALINTIHAEHVKHVASLECANKQAQ